MTDLVCCVDWASAQDKTVVSIIQNNKLIAMFEGKDSILKAVAWAKIRNLKMDLEIKK